MRAYAVRLFEHVSFMTTAIKKSRDTNLVYLFAIEREVKDWRLLVLGNSPGTRQDIFLPRPLATGVAFVNRSDRLRAIPTVHCAILAAPVD